MRTIPRLLLGLFLSLFLSAIPGCFPANGGESGSPDVVELPITGTIYTIVFENHGLDAVFDPSNAYFNELAREYGTADAYLSNDHPSLLNYMVMTSGSTRGFGDNGPPASHAVDGHDNLADQLEAAGITWRAYMEGMGDPCRTEDVGEYAVKHNPFVYYTSLTDDRARCEEHVVDFDEHFADDLAANEYQYVWITPDMCNSMHDCPPSTADAWLADVIPQIMDSPGYREGGAIFILWDEGDADATYAWSYVFGRPQNVPAIVISDTLVYPGFASNTHYDHHSYLATIEDAFGLPRLPTTVAATPMADFFLPDPWPNAISTSDVDGTDSTDDDAVAP
jgi:phospholipase C